MSILRNEIPKPLNPHLMLELISNPNLNGFYNTNQQQQQQQPPPSQTSYQKPALISSTFISSSSPTQQQQPPALHASDHLLSSSSSFNVPKPPALLSTHNNDGTTCVYYPNGQLALLVVASFGFTVENASSSNSINQANTMFTTDTSKQSSTIQPVQTDRHHTYTLRFLIKFLIN
jgi:hypothetical protein